MVTGTRPVNYPSAAVGGSSSTLQKMLQGLKGLPKGAKIGGAGLLGLLGMATLMDHGNGQSQQQGNGYY